MTKKKFFIFLFWRTYWDLKVRGSQFLATNLLIKTTSIFFFTPQFAKTNITWQLNDIHPTTNTTAPKHHQILMALAARALPNLQNPRKISHNPKPKTRNDSFFSKPSIRASSMASTPEEGQLERPRWTGETPLSRLVGALISFKPLYSLMKLGARQVLIRSVIIKDFTMCGLKVLILCWFWGSIFLKVRLRNRTFHGGRWRRRFLSPMCMMNSKGFETRLLCILIVSCNFSLVFWEHNFSLFEINLLLNISYVTLICMNFL